jgi:hypothetical protein
MPRIVDVLAISWPAGPLLITGSGSSGGCGARAPEKASLAFSAQRSANLASGYWAP